MRSIFLEDLLRLKEQNSRVKIKFNVRNEENEEPLDIWLEDPSNVDHDWLFWRAEKRNFEVGDIAVCLVRIYSRTDMWLLTTVQKIDRELDVTNGVNYEGHELEEYKKYFGRVIVSFHNDARTTVRLYEDSDLPELLAVTHILPAPYDKNTIL